MSWSRDVPASGLAVWQPTAGFRYGAEAFWLTGMVIAHGVPATALDLGTGSGVLAWLLARAGSCVDAIDVRPEWAEGWARSIAECVVRGEVHLRLGDVREVRSDRRYACVVCNPPFFAQGTGPTPSDPWRSAARSESTAVLADFVEVACASLTDSGRAWFVVPIEREAELVAAIPGGFGALRVVRIGARRVIVAIGAGAGRCEPEQVRDRGAEVAHWYALATG